MTKKPITASEMGRRGGKARAAKLTPEELSRIGKRAVQARERKRRLRKQQEAVTKRSA